MGKILQWQRQLAMKVYYRTLRIQKYIGLQWLTYLYDIKHNIRLLSNSLAV